MIPVVACCHGAKLYAHATRDFRSQQAQSGVATCQLALHWMCDSPRTGCARRITPIGPYTVYVAQTSNNRVIPIEWSWWVTFNNACEASEQLIILANGDGKSELVISNVACCYSVKLCVLAAQAFLLQQWYNAFR